RPRLRVRPPQGCQVPQRRSRDRGGRQVLTRALPGHQPQDPQGPGRGGRDAGPLAGSHPPQAAVARLHDLLLDRHRRRLDRAQEVRGEGGRGGYKKSPVGAGPYRFVSFTPGVELVLEAFEQYWRKTPSVKHLVFKVIPDESTRLAALKRGEVDVVYSIRGELAEELQRTPGLTLKPAVIQAPQWVNLLDQWDPKSPWHD